MRVLGSGFELWDSESECCVLGIEYFGGAEVSSGLSVLGWGGGKDVSGRWLSPR